jgi:hypothetical protein
MVVRFAIILIMVLFGLIVFYALANVLFFH